jgi:hypothetical protein
MPETKPIPREVKQIAGYDSIEELRGAIPANVDEPANAGAAPKKARKPRAPKAPAAPVTPDPMLDPRYVKAVGNMSAFGGKRIIIRGFDAGATMLEDEKFSLNDEEKQVWDDFFYVLSKRPLFDIGKPWFLALFFVVTLFSQLGWRVLERTEQPFLKQLFPDKEEQEEEFTNVIADQPPQRGVRPVSEDSTLGGPRELRTL